MAYIASIGFFDGVHRGHLSLIDQLRTKASLLDLETMLVTFSSHPRALIEGVTPPLLLTHDERMKRLNRTGINRVVEMDFEQIRSFTAQMFMQLLHDQYQVSALLMGYDHRFGSDRLNKIEDYARAGAHAGVEVYLAEQAEEGAVSSTKIRRALEEGRMEEANQMLGYHYTLTGEVVHGQHIGATLGFPTANLLLPTTCYLLPKKGVYAALVMDRKALVNIGTNPTFGMDNPLSVEVHIPNFSGDLYGQTLQVELLSYLREDRRFGSKQLLIGQILQDIDQLAHLLQ